MWHASQWKVNYHNIKLNFSCYMFDKTVLRNTWSILPLSQTVTFLDPLFSLTGYNRSHTLSSRLDLPGFWPGNETKWEVWLLWTWFGIVPMSKLVSLTWLLWALRSFPRFTLNTITFPWSMTHFMHCAFLMHKASVCVGHLYFGL